MNNPIEYKSSEGFAALCNEIGCGAEFEDPNLDLAIRLPSSEAEITAKGYRVLHDNLVGRSGERLLLVAKPTNWRPDNA